ncbi:hypothetical protein [Ferdinandcohnia sp. SAFN-114]|uniref:hypothetical protein n=1 Tax=Ferdinandcohnia sp. SAFN-114 TaxID=3387275 RepID=UPI003F80E6CB
MEEYFITETIRGKLKEYSIGTYDDLKPSLKSNLVRIEGYFQECLDKFRKIELELNEIELNTRGICIGAHISKSTVYNNPDTLLKYIDKRKVELECNIELINRNRIKALEEEVEKQKDIIDKLIIDNIEFMNQKLLIENLQKENKRLLNYKEVHSRERAELIRQKDEMSIELKKIRNNLIEFPTK